MAAIFAAKTDKEEGLYLEKAFLHQSQPIPSSAQFSWDRLRSSTETQVKDEVNHVRRQLCLIEFDNVKTRVQPREKFHRVSGQKLGNHELSVTASLSTQCIRHDQVKSGSPTEKQQFSHRSKKVDYDSELDNYDDIDSSTPPPPSDLEALHKTWEQVNLYNTKMSKVSAQKNSTVTVMADRHL